MKYTFKSINTSQSTYGFLGHVIDMTNKNNLIIATVFSEVFYMCSVDTPINQEILDLVKRVQYLNK